MQLTMRRIAYALVSLAFAGSGRRVHTAHGLSQRDRVSEAMVHSDRRGSAQGDDGAMNMLAQLLAEHDPAVAFSPSGPGFAPQFGPALARQQSRLMPRAGATRMKRERVKQSKTEEEMVKELETYNPPFTEPDHLAENFYTRLGVPVGSDYELCRQGFAKAVRKYHPSCSKRPDCQMEMSMINEAYNVIKNPKRKELYDKYGKEAAKRYDPNRPEQTTPGYRGGFPGGFPGGTQFGGSGDLGDIFDAFFGGGGGGGAFGGQQRSSGPKQGDDLRFDLEIDLQTALFGGSKKIKINGLQSCNTCSGSGVAPGSKVTTCAMCQGRGVVVQEVQTILGVMQQQGRCPKCQGEGKIVEKFCGTCDGRGLTRGSKEVTINIPVGVEDGNRLRVKGEGDAGPKGGPKGDLYVFITVKKDPDFQREGMNIYSDIKVSAFDAMLGTTVRVKTVDGEVDLKIPAGTQPGTKFPMKGKGAPRLNNKNDRGVHEVTVAVDIPRKLSEKEQQLVTQLRDGA